MSQSRSEREAFAVGSIVFTLVAVVLAFAALWTAAQAESRSRETNRRVAKLAAGGVIASTANVNLREYSIASRPGLVKSGRVKLHVDNTGTITHELVIVRAASPSALPVVQVAGERAVGAIDEEAIPETDKMGETGDVAAGSSVTKTFDLPPGSYVMFCNIDSKSDGTMLNHFMKGMVATLVVI